MIPNMPAVFLDDDLMPSRPMATHGVLLGFSSVRCMWRFGFIPNSDLARAFRISTDRPLYALTLLSGRVLDTRVWSWREAPPRTFMNVIEAKV